MVLIDQSDLAKLYRQWLSQNAHCIIGIAQDERSLLVVSEALHLIDRHVILSMNNKNPLRTLGKNMKRPFFWVHHHEMVINLLAVCRERVLDFL